MKSGSAIRLRSLLEAPPASQAAYFSLGSGLLAAGVATYYYVVFLGLKDPFTHVFPVTFDYFAYLRYYQQVQANYLLSAVTSAALVAIALALSKLDGSVKPALMLRLGSLLRGVPLRTKTVSLLIPLLLLETGLWTYGGLMGVARYDLALSLQLRDNPFVRDLFLGPFSSSTGAYGNAQDYYFLILYGTVLVTVLYRFGSVRRLLQIGSLSILPLPALVLLFDPLEFNTFFASVAFKVGLGWFSNALLLYLAAAVFVGATSYPLLRRLAGRALRRMPGIPA